MGRILSSLYPDTTNTIVRAEFVGVQAWLQLQEIMKDELAAGSAFRLLTVPLYSIRKAINEPASSWLKTNEPLLRDPETRLKDLMDIDADHHIHLGKAKAHMGVRVNIRILADAAANAVVTQKILDADLDNMGNSFSRELLN